MDKPLAVESSPMEAEGAKPERSTVQVLGGLLAKIQISKVLLFMASLALFILAILLMKEGARALIPLVRDNFQVNNPANSLGFGWLFAYTIMSGSPVAAAALTFLDAGAITATATFTMITGSRFGASFIVLFIGFIYVLRGNDQSSGLGMGLLSLSVTFTTYILGLVVGIGLLQSGILEGVRLGAGGHLNSVLDAVFGPVVDQIVNVLPAWSLFLVGLGIIMVSFNLFDRCLPQMTLKESQVGRVSRMVYRPWVMFLLGAGITTISMSVSVSLSILVPLSNRGFIRRENVIPYIMGANITTFIDTLVASLLISHPAAFTVVLAEMLSITLVSMIILATAYRRYERAMLGFVSWVTRRKRNLTIFMVSIFVVPLLLMLL